MLKDIQIPNCRLIKYSHGGHFLAVNEKEHIFIYDSVYYETLNVPKCSHSCFRFLTTFKTSPSLTMTHVLSPPVSMVTSTAFHSTTRCTARTTTTKKATSTNSPRLTPASPTTTRSPLLIRMTSLLILTCSLEPPLKNISSYTRTNVRSLLQSFP